MVTPRPTAGSSALVLADGTALRGRGIGAHGAVVGEVCFNTAMTGYQEILTDPSYAGQIIVFTFPHIGNVGVNDDDVEALTPRARGAVIHADITRPSNFRSLGHLDRWMATRGLVGICGVDTRRLTRLIREAGAPNAALCHAASESELDLDGLQAAARDWPGLVGLDLARDVTCAQRYSWDETAWTFPGGYGRRGEARHHVVAIDYGAKRNILRCLASAGCRVTVVPAETPAEDVLALAPDGVFLSNGPGDPAATGAYAVPVIRRLVDQDLPVFGICLGHQLLALALGGRTEKMKYGHHGANHPVKDLSTGRVEITSQNHGFAVPAESLPPGVRGTHVSLFDGSLEGLEVDGRPVYSVQYHPEASPGPQDSHHLFARFVLEMDRRA